MKTTKRRIILNPKIRDNVVDCPKEGCGGEISLRKKGEEVCYRCFTRVIHVYHWRKRIAKISFLISINGYQNFDNDH